MKKFFKIVIIFIVTSGFAQGKNNFSLIGKTNNIPDGTILKLSDPLLDKMIDSVKVLNNSFKLTTTLPDYPYQVILWKDDANVRSIWAENNKMTFDATTSNFEDAIITGSVTDDLAIQLRNTQRTLKTYEEKVALEFDFINKNPNTILSAFSLSVMAGVFGIEKSAALFEKFSAKNKQSLYGKKISAFLNLSITETPKIGEKYADFEMEDQKGIPHKFSEFEGKVILLEFWASWCVPCRNENPGLIKTYNKFKDSGFEIVAISLDEDKKRWIDAIKKDGLPWKHLSDLKGQYNLAALIYKVNNIPDNVLIDKNRIVIGRNLRGEKLNSLLDKTFATPSTQITQTEAGTQIKLKNSVKWQDETGKELSQKEAELLLKDSKYSLNFDTEKNIMIVKKTL